MGVPEVARRVITPGLFEDEWFGGLEDREQLVWIGLFGVLADDQGRLLDNPALIRARLWPYRDVSASHVAEALERFTSDKRLHRYIVADKPLLQIVKWWKHQKPQWASRSDLPAPDGWQDRVRTRQSGEYIEDGWKMPGGFALAPQANCSGEQVQVNCSGGPFSLARGRAHDPDPEPEPLPDRSFEDGRPVDHIDPAPPNARSKGTKRSTLPTCDGEPCRIRELRCDIRRDVALIVGEPEAATLYGGHSDLSKTFLTYSAKVCELCQVQFAQVERPGRDEKCQAVMKASVERILSAHRGTPIDNLPAYLNGELKRLTHIGDLCGDDLVCELRHERASRATTDGREPERLKGLRDRLPQPAVPETVA